MSEINSKWVDAPYRVGFCFWVPRCPRKNWSRKRRLKWRRRETKRILRSFRPPPIHEFDINNFCGEREMEMMSPIIQPKWVNEEGWVCPACEGDITSPHIANCMMAPGN